MAVSLPASIELPQPGRPVAPTHLGEHLYILLERRAAHQTHPSSPAAALASPVTAVTVTDSWLSRQESRRVVTQSPLCCHRYRCSRPLLRPLRVAVSTVLRGTVLPGRPHLAATGSSCLPPLQEAARLLAPGGRRQGDV